MMLTASKDPLCWLLSNAKSRRLILKAKIFHLRAFNYPLVLPNVGEFASEVLQILSHLMSAAEPLMKLNLLTFSCLIGLLTHYVFEESSRRNKS